MIGDDFLTVLAFDVFAACLARVIVRPTIEAEGTSQQMPSHKVLMTKTLDDSKRGETRDAKYGKMD